MFWFIINVVGFFCLFVCFVFCLFVLEKGEWDRERVCPWLNPCVCFQREHQRLRQFERDNQQIQERLRTVTAINDEIKEENSE